MRDSVRPQIKSICLICRRAEERLKRICRDSLPPSGEGETAWCRSVFVPRQDILRQVRGDVGTGALFAVKISLCLQLGVCLGHRGTRQREIFGEGAGGREPAAGMEAA